MSNCHQMTEISPFVQDTKVKKGQRDSMMHA